MKLSAGCGVQLFSYLLPPCERARVRQEKTSLVPVSLPRNLLLRAVIFVTFFFPSSSRSLIIYIQIRRSEHDQR